MIPDFQQNIFGNAVTNAPVSRQWWHRQFKEHFDGQRDRTEQGIHH
jgi:hypothetical protein